MMQRYNSSSQGQYCHYCGMFHHHSQSCYNNNNNDGSSFSMVFSVQNGGVFEQTNGCSDYYSSSSSSSSSAVDCTLSLGTPSTRLCEEDEKRRRSTSSGGSSCMSNFWDLLHTKNNSKGAPYNLPPYSSNTKASRGGSGGGVGNDPLLARRCANCDTTSTPLWRNGPRGPKSLCNACGIRFKKEERRTTAANGGAPAPVAADQHGHHASYNYHNATGNSSWVRHAQAQRVPCYGASEFRFIDDVGGSGAGDHHHHHSDSDSASAVPYLSWRLNVADRASLVHDFTR